MPLLLVFQFFFQDKNTLLIFLITVLQANIETPQYTKSLYNSQSLQSPK